MDSAATLRDFLTSRRGRITPGEVGLPAGGRRRVSGLRREEVALLAGVSVDYYVQIERGRIGAVSDEVVHAIARALRLDEAETAHLFDLARAGGPGTRRAPRPRRRPARVPDGVQHLLDAMVGAPAVVLTSGMDAVAANTLGRALYVQLFDARGSLAGPSIERGSGPPNLARYLFEDTRALDFFPQWERVADTVVAILRVEAGRAPYNRELTDLVGELATRSVEFRARWAAHDVTAHRSGAKSFRHPVVGELTLHYEALQILGSPEHTLYGFTAEPGSAAADALALLASWAATSTGDGPAVDLRRG